MKFASRAEVWIASTVALALVTTASAIEDKLEGSKRLADRSSSSDVASRDLFIQDLPGEGEVDQCRDMTLEGTEYDGDYVDIGWSFGDRPIFLSSWGDVPVVLVYIDGGPQLLSSTSSDDWEEGQEEYSYSFNSASYSFNSASYSFDSKSSFDNTNYSTSGASSSRFSSLGSGWWTRRGLLRKGAKADNAHESGESGSTEWFDEKRVLDSLASSISLGGRNSAISAIINARPALAECSDGLWLLVRFFLIEEEFSPFPIYITFDCALHPTDISSPWMVIDEPAGWDEGSSLSAAEEVEEAESSAFEDPQELPTVDVAFSCAEQLLIVEEGKNSGCVDLGAGGCESESECCASNYPFRRKIGTADCWDNQCCNRTGRGCEKDTQCCKGLSCMNGVCANPFADVCTILGDSGCAKSNSCCGEESNILSADAVCVDGRCCKKKTESCANDTHCCRDLKCDMETYTCKRSKDV